MNGKERREKIVKLLRNSETPLTGKYLAELLGVSRQIIVQDITLLRAQSMDITATNAGYVLLRPTKQKRVFKVIHNENQVEEELNLIVDFGGTIEDVFVYHKVYGTVHGAMKVGSRHDVKKFIETLENGKSSLLMNVTSGYHYHTVSAPSRQILDMIQQKLQEYGFLAKLKDYEPIDFWSEEENL